MIPDEAVKAAADYLPHSADCETRPGRDCSCRHLRVATMRAALEAATPHILRGDVEWTVFRASDGENGSPAENLRYSTKAGAQESIDTRYGTPELWEPRSRIVGEWTK